MLVFNVTANNNNNNLKKTAVNAKCKHPKDFQLVSQWVVWNSFFPTTFLSSPHWALEAQKKKKLKIIEVC